MFYFLNKGDPATAWYCFLYSLAVSKVDKKNLLAVYIVNNDWFSKHQSGNLIPQKPLTHTT